MLQHVQALRSAVSRPRPFRDPRHRRTVGDIVAVVDLRLEQASGLTAFEDGGRNRHARNDDILARIYVEDARRVVVDHNGRCQVAKTNVFAQDLSDLLFDQKGSITISSSVADACCQRLHMESMFRKFGVSDLR